MNYADFSAYLSTRPPLGEVLAIQELCAQYRAAQIAIELLWARHLPCSTWGDDERRQQFRAIFLGLRAIGFSTTYHKSSADDLHLWNVRDGRYHTILQWHLDTELFTLARDTLPDTTDFSRLPDYLKID